MSFKIPLGEYKEINGEPCAYQLQVNGMCRYPRVGYPTQRMRYMTVKPGLYLVELWLENSVKGKGVLGKAVTKLVSRYYRRRIVVNDEDGTKSVVYKTVGEYSAWGFDGRLAHTGIRDDDGREELLYYVEYDTAGKLTSWLDKRNGRDLEVKFTYDEGRRVTQLWRGRFAEKTSLGYGRRDDGYTVRRDDAGRPLTCDDYVTRTYSADGTLKQEEAYIAGCKHGFVRTYNKFGRVIAEQYWVRDVEVPDWVYLDPKGVTPEEIQDEEDDKLRAIMLELQGPELYQVRTMARAMKAVSRATLEMSDADVVSGLAVKRTKLEE